MEEMLEAGYVPAGCGKSACPVGMGPNPRTVQDITRIPYGVIQLIGSSGYSEATAIPGLGFVLYVGAEVRTADGEKVEIVYGELNPSDGTEGILDRLRLLLCKAGGELPRDAVKGVGEFSIDISRQPEIELLTATPDKTAWPHRKVLHYLKSHPLFGTFAFTSW